MPGPCVARSMGSATQGSINTPVMGKHNVKRIVAAIYRKRMMGFTGCLTKRSKIARIARRWQQGARTVLSEEERLAECQKVAERMYIAGMGWNYDAIEKLTRAEVPASVALCASERMPEP